MLKGMKRVVAAVLIISSLSTTCFAADSGMKDVFENSLYGGVVGALVGTACLAFTSRPSDHLNYISVGAATGVLIGVGYTLAKQSRSLVSIENGNLQVAMPTIRPEFLQASSKDPGSIMLKADLLSGSF